MDRCPNRVFLENPAGMSQIMWYYGNYKRGVMPVSGGLLDQPGALMDIFYVIDGALNTIEAAKAEEQKRKEAAGKRGQQRRRR